ncbi:Hsp20/alpha crystallin family protein [Plantactinospora sp. KBS50]|uniref:Hsp20/alpha crystallin family protein n=1 Tax=Plantactinospora sp. KBS50 TaxID=2024580 RepID=UPI000BAAEA91|nr:Hsp20/alpha crystallin family protein [Plantactinospora sp. KBS50]ASW53301.1 heat-shock protein Hsp20 [Plantactinospora sp. KBS50]
MTAPRRADRWDPLAELQALRAELGRLVGTALVGSGGGTPDVELTESADGWRVVARLPGVAPDEVAVELDDRDLCIRARSEEEVNTDLGMPGSGSRSRSFEHRVALPSQVDADRIDAVMDHGLLTVHLPRSSRSSRRTITIGRASYGAGLPAAVSPDPAADRELHHPDVADTTLRRPS